MVKKKTKKKGSSNSTNKPFDTVSDYIDLISQMIAEYFNRRYKIEKKVSEIKKATLQTLFNLKKEFMKAIIETMFLTTGLLALIIGSLLLVSRFVALEYLLIFYGLIVSIVVLLKMKVDV